MHPVLNLLYLIFAYGQPQVPREEYFQSAMLVFHTKITVITKLHSLLHKESLLIFHVLKNISSLMPW